MYRRLMMLAAMAVGLAGCDPVTYHHWQEFGIQVNDITIPESVASGQAFTIQFTGVIGPTTCHRFHEFVTEMTPGQLGIALIGRADVRPGSSQCLPEPNQLTEQESFTVRGATQDPFRIVVHQPDGTRLERTVRIR